MPHRKENSDLSTAQSGAKHSLEDGIETRVEAVR